MMKKFGFGMMRLPQIDENPEHIDQEQLNKMIDIYMDNGYNYFDTAYPYHNGKSEVAFKEGVVKRYPRESYIIADKFPLFFVKKPEDLEKLFHEQIERTGVEYFDYYMLHNLCSWTDKALDIADCFKFIADKKEAGQIKNI